MLGAAGAADAAVTGAAAGVTGAGISFNFSSSGVPRLGILGSKDGTLTAGISCEACAIWAKAASEESLSAVGGTAGATGVTGAAGATGTAGTAGVDGAAGADFAPNDGASEATGCGAADEAGAYDAG